LLLVPQIAASVHGAAFAAGTLTAAGTLGSPMASPFSSSPASTCPYARISNFNVTIGGVNWYSQNVNYGWEQYNNEIRKSRTIYGNSKRGIASGLITQSDWETNHCFIYVNLDRWGNEAVDNQLKALSITFTNSCAVTLDFTAFVFYEREITVNTSSGTLIL
jgi:hypothetical protein